MEKIGAVLKAQTELTVKQLGQDVHDLWTLSCSTPLASLLTSKAEKAERIQRSKVAIAASRETAELGEKSLILIEAQHNAAIRRWEGEIEQLDRQIELAKVRDTVEAKRPEGCWCLGLGGRGVLTVMRGARIWSEWCDCAEGLAFHAAAVAAEESAAQEELERQAAIAKAERERERQRRLQEANLPKHFSDFTLATFPAQKATQAIIARLQEFGVEKAKPRSVFLWGEPGRGKTGLSMAALQAWIAAGRGGLFVTVPDLLDWLRPQQGQNGLLKRSTNVMDRIADVPLLVLDDLGAQKTTIWARERLYVLINHRHDWSLPTIITSNYSLSHTAQRLASDDEPIEGDRIVWRIKEMCDVYELRGRNLRA